MEESKNILEMKYLKQIWRYAILKCIFDINATDFQILINKAIEISSKKYDLNSYNCSSYGLEIINSIRNDKISSVPIAANVWIAVFSYVQVYFDQSPSGLYQSLLNRKNSGIESTNIEIGVVNHAPSSTGECF